MQSRPSPLTKEQQREWILAWRRAAPVLEEERRKQARDSDTLRDIPAFDGLFEMAVRDNPPLPHSGLVDFHRRLQPLGEQHGAGS